MYSVLIMSDFNDKKFINMLANYKDITGQDDFYVDCVMFATESVCEFYVQANDVKHKYLATYGYDENGDFSIKVNTDKTVEDYEYIMYVVEQMFEYITAKCSY